MKKPLIQIYTNESGDNIVIRNENNVTLKEAHSFGVWDLADLVDALGFTAKITQVTDHSMEEGTFEIEV